MNIEHMISFHEWLAGFSLILDCFILFTIIGYMIKNRVEIYQPHYCIAFGLTIYMLGHTFRTGIIWYTLFSHPQYNTLELLAEHFPIAGNIWWAIGSCIAAVGLVKMIRTFGESYLNEYIWLVALTCAMIIPLFSLWV